MTCITPGRRLRTWLCSSASTALRVCELMKFVNVSATILCSLQVLLGDGRRLTKTDSLAEYLEGVGKFPPSPGQSDEPDKAILLEWLDELPVFKPPGLSDKEVEDFDRGDHYE